MAETYNTGGNTNAAPSLVGTTPTAAILNGNNVALKGGSGYANSGAAISPNNTTYSPTVVSSQGAIDRQPAINAKANSYTAPGAATTNPNIATTGSTANAGNQDYSNMSYADILKSSLSGLNGQSIDPAVQAELDLIGGQKRNQDAVTEASVQSIQNAYQSRYADTQQQQRASTAGLDQALNLGGSSRYAPISSSGILSSKERFDIQTLNELQTTENSEIAKLRQAQADKDYKSMSDQLAILDKVRSDKIAMAGKIAENMVSQNNANRQYNLSLSQFNETKFKDAAQLAQSSLEFRDAHDQFGNVIGTQTFDKTTGKPVSGIISNGVGGTSAGATQIPDVQLLPNGAPDPVTQEAFLKTIPQAFQQLVKNVANYQTNPSQLTSKTKTQIESWASQYDPTYDSKNYSTRQALQTNFATGKYSVNKTALNTAIGHMADLVGNFAKLSNGSVPGLNAVKNAYGSATGAGGITSASTNINAGVGELASTFKSSGATDSEIKNLGTLSTNSSPEQAKAFVETAVQLLASRLQALTDTYTEGMGKPPATSFLSPTNISALSKLKNAGYKVDIPGVNFTDPVAYTKADSTNAQELASVRAQFPDLSPADALAQAQYNQSQGQ